MTSEAYIIWSVSESDRSNATIHVVVRSSGELRHECTTVLNELLHMNARIQMAYHRLMSRVSKQGCVKCLRARSLP